MKTECAQILPIVLPLPKAGLSAPANVASADAKATSSAAVDEVGPEDAASDEGSVDPSQSLSAFDLALAQMMMVQAPVSQSSPQAPSQQGLATRPIDIAAALDALQPGSGLGLAPAMGGGSDPTAPLMTPPIPQAANQNALMKAANFAEPAPSVFEQVQSEPIDLALSKPQAPTSQVQPSVAQVDTAPVVPSVSKLVQATADRPSQASILQAMGNAAEDITARVTGISVPQPISTPNQTALPPPEPDQAQTAQSTLVQAQSAAPAQATLQATAQTIASAQVGARQTAQANSRETTPTLASSATASTSTPSVAGPLTSVAIAENGSASRADTGGAFQDAPLDLSEAVPAQNTQSDTEVSTDIFGAPLPLEGRLTQASLQPGSSATLSTPTTAPHLAAELSRRFEGKSAQFDISLTPEGLGKVDVKITINARGEVSAAMKFDNPQAAAELKGRAAELQRALEQSGFSLSQEGISFSDGQGFGAAQQQANQQDWQEAARRTAQNRLFQDTNELADAAALRVAEASSAYSRRSSTGVDVRI